MAGAVDAALVKHLAREDGQEDLCFATWRPSTGRSRQTALVIKPILPGVGERHVHGNASFRMSYALRAAHVAADRGEGLAFLHAHPGARGWQALSGADTRAEASIANLAREITGLPLLGLTLATGDGCWSSRTWDTGLGRAVGYTPSESVRVVGTTLRVSYNHDLRPRPEPQLSQRRTTHAWGEEVQADLARLRVLVVGAGSVGLHIVESLARTGIAELGVLDFDRVEFMNLDRLHGATRLDAALRRLKIDVARRILRAAATARDARHEIHEESVCEPAGLETALDFDVIFSCVDRPWPRHVLNTIAYADLIPVIDGGLRLDPLPVGGLRNAVWRSHVATAGRPCLVCIGQYDPSHVQLERDGSLDSPSYIASLPAGSPLRANQNVSALSIAVASALLNQFLMLVVAPSGLGDPGPLRHDLARHCIEFADVTTCTSECPYQGSVGDGDRRLDPTGRHAAPAEARTADSRLTSLVRSGLSWVERATYRASEAIVRLSAAGRRP